MNGSGPRGERERRRLSDGCPIDVPPGGRRQPSCDGVGTLIRCCFDVMKGAVDGEKLSNV